MVRPGDEGKDPQPHHGQPQHRRKPSRAAAHSATSPPPKPPPAPAKPPKASWWLPSPLILTASDPGAADGKLQHGTIGRIIIPGVCPLWRCDAIDGSGTGWLAQIEGYDQLETALGYLRDKPPGDSRAIVGIGNVPANRMLDLGVNVAFYELNAQAGWEPYGNEERMVFQGHQDGWPFVYPSYGCYDGIGLQHYRDYVPLVWDNTINDFVRGTRPQGLAPVFAVFSAEGMGDTDSWPVLEGI